MRPRALWEPQNRWTRCALAALALPLAALACGDGALGPRRESCDSFCEKLELCDDGTDVSGCVQNCVQQVVRSDEYLFARAQCIAVRSCNTFAREVGSMGEDLCGDRPSCSLNDCTSDLLARRPRTSKELDYCSAITSKLGACQPELGSSDLESHCLELVPTLSGEYLDVVEGCVRGDCATVRACLERAADRFNTDVTLAPVEWLVQSAR